MKFDPKETEADLFPEGWYPAVIQAAEDRVSKKKNAPYIWLSLKVYNGGKSTDVEGILFNTGARNVTRLRGLCEATGLPFSGGNIDPAQLVNKDVDVRLGIQSDDEWGDRNTPWAYAVQGAKSDAPSGGADPHPTPCPATPAPVAEMPEGGSGDDPDGIPF